MGAVGGSPCGAVTGIHINIWEMNMDQHTESQPTSPGDVLPLRSAKRPWVKPVLEQGPLNEATNGSTTTFDPNDGPTGSIAS